MPPSYSRSAEPAPARSSLHPRPVANERARSTVRSLANRWRLSPAVQRELAAYRRGQSLPFWHHDLR